MYFLHLLEYSEILIKSFEKENLIINKIKKDEIMEKTKIKFENHTKTNLSKSVRHLNI